MPKRRNEFVVGLLFCLFTLFTIDAKSQIQYLGLYNAGLTTDLTIYGDTIYASTEDGIYKRPVNVVDTNWISCGMQGNHVVQTLVKDYQNFICLVEIGTTFTTQIYKSDDGGNSFQLLHPGISLANGYQYLDAIAHPENNYDTLYFLNHRIKTYDGGQTWDTLLAPLLSDRFITLNPENHQQLLIGGETMILSPYLQTSLDTGNTWNMLAMNNFFSGDNSVHDLAFDGNNWYAAGEGVICKSTDGGDNWTQLINYWSGPPHFSLYFNDIEFSPTDKYRMYVTGANSTANNIPLLISYGQGSSFWDTLSFPTFDSANPDMKCLAIDGDFIHDAVYIGGHCVYLYNNVFSQINETNKSATIFVYPNPCSSELHFSNPVKKNFSFRLFDLTGQELLILKNPNQVDMENFSAGIYFIEINTGEKYFRQKLIID